MNLIDTLAYTYGTDHKRMAQALDTALAELDRLRIENAALRAENRQLRRRLRDSELRTVRQAERDATYILALHLAGMITSRAACLSYGVSRRRWTWAIALLKVGMVHSGGGIVDADPGELAAGVRFAVKRCEREGMTVLQARAPRNGYSGLHRSRAQSRAALNT